MKKKAIVLFLACALLIGCAIGGTLAWLTAKTAPVINTFTVGDIQIALDETTEDFQMVPGYTIAKDPKVTVNADSEACWLFVKVEKSTSPAFDSYCTFNIADGWTELTAGSGIYYREVAAVATDTPFYVLKDNQVTVKETVTKEMMETIDGGKAKPTLTFTAYACQLFKENTEKFTPEEAWAKVSVTP